MVRTITFFGATVGVSGGVAAQESVLQPARLNEQLAVDELATQLQLVREQNSSLRTQVGLLELERDALLSQLGLVQQVLADHGLIDEAIARANRQPSTPPSDPVATRDATDTPSSTVSTDVEEQFNAAEWVKYQPFSSPWALRGAIVRSYFDDLSNIPRTTAREEDLFHDAVARWTRKVSRELRSQVQWVVSLENVERDKGASRRYTGKLRVVDPATGFGIGRPIEVQVPERYAVRVIRAPEVSYWGLRAEVIAEPRYNPDRADRGIFDEPPIIGPFVEHGWKIVWRNLQPWKAMEPEQER